MTTYDLVVIGANPPGLSLAAEATEAGLEHVLVVERGPTATPSSAIGRFRLNVRYQCSITKIVNAGGALELTVDGEQISATTVAYAEVPPGTALDPGYVVPPEISSRIHHSIDTVPGGPHDVLVIGGGEQAVEQVERSVERGDQVVFALTTSARSLSRLSEQTLEEIETARRATILWRAEPTAIDVIDGYPMVAFERRGTPELQFDHVIHACGIQVDVGAFSQLGIEVDADPERFFILQDTDEQIAHHEGSIIPAGRAWDAIRQRSFPHLPAPAPPPAPEVAADLGERHYNATITHFDKTHSDLWRIRIRPDVGDTSHRAGQYATIGLGYWEERIDAAVDPGDDDRRQKLIRRSYSISSPVLDDHGYLVDPHELDEIEFYIVLVPPTDGHVPALTPRLARKQVGDRLYLGPRIAGRYTLAPVQDPSDTVVLLSTGTGEAPHNAMIGELLRKGHHGPIVSVVSVRHSSDLAYADLHKHLSDRFAHFHYVMLPTREPNVPKRYIQTVLADGTFESIIGVTLDPDNTHVFLCGNPAMIGPPTWDGDQPTFPSPKGAVEVLWDLGFVPDRRGHSGNVHFEEYW